MGPRDALVAGLVLVAHFGLSVCSEMSCAEQLSCLVPICHLDSICVSTKDIDETIMFTVTPENLNETIVDQVQRVLMASALESLEPGPGPEPTGTTSNQPETTRVVATGESNGSTVWVSDATSDPSSELTTRVAPIMSTVSIASDRKSTSSAERFTETGTETGADAKIWGPLKSTTRPESELGTAPQAESSSGSSPDVETEEAQQPITMTGATIRSMEAQRSTESRLETSAGAGAWTGQGSEPDGTSIDPTVDWEESMKNRDKIKIFFLRKSEKISATLRTAWNPISMVIYLGTDKVLRKAEIPLEGIQLRSQQAIDRDGLLKDLGIQIGVHQPKTSSKSGAVITLLIVALMVTVMIGLAIRLSPVARKYLIKDENATEAHEMGSVQSA
ncbi:uncharacterized protein LOC100902286 [Galendromus occidentalis]|uniref:Uncharacterized protein LOC100902286 n=1 Tax=Galendromus occidentalis TaxID=34638 RepID=A0AAJ6QYK1_9ACAR|nr:uncharacterized protein LOC100902286 [Galendromus occidentalis]